MYRIIKTAFVVVFFAISFSTANAYTYETTSQTSVWTGRANLTQDGLATEFGNLGTVKIPFTIVLKAPATRTFNSNYLFISLRCGVSSYMTLDASTIASQSYNATTKEVTVNVNQHFWDSHYGSCSAQYLDTIRLSVGDSTTPAMSWIGSTEDPIAGGDAVWTNTSGTGNASDSFITDLYVDVIYTQVPTVSITTPTGALTGDFTDFKLSMFTGTEGFNGKSGVLYGTSTPPTTYNDTFATNFDYTNAVTKNKTYAVYIKKNTPLIAGNYYAQGYIKNSLGVTIATSTITSFSIDNGSPIDTGVNSTTTALSTSTSVVLTCDPNSGLFQNSFCNLFICLFKPSDGTFDRYNGIWDMMSVKPPLGYFTQIKNSMENIDNATSSAFTFEDMSQLNGSLFDDLKDGVAMLLWFMFGIWIFNRFRHIQL